MSWTLLNVIIDDLDQTLRAISHFWYISLPLVLNFLIASWKNWPYKRKINKNKYLILYPILFMFLILLTGSITGYFTTSENIFEPSGYFVYGLGLLSILIGGMSIYKMRGYRWFVISLFLLEVWVLIWIIIMAGLSIGHDSF